MSVPKAACPYATCSDATWQYVTGQMRPTFPALLDSYQRDSDAVCLTAADVAYGPHPRQVFDVVTGTAPWQGTLAYFHAGFWQSRDKSLFRFIAPLLARQGIDVALVNYPLCPDVTLPQLVAATRAAVSAVLAHSRAAGRGGARLIAAGHSAGGHIAVELALSDWQAALPICGVAALSGVYDLEPLLGTPLNDKLRLTRPVARAMSPVRRVRTGIPSALFVAGGAETPAFQAQSAGMHEAWRNAGNTSEHVVVEGADHFSLLRAFQQPSALLERVMALARIGTQEQCV